MLLRWSSVSSTTIDAARRNRQPLIALGDIDERDADGLHDEKRRCDEEDRLANERPRSKTGQQRSRRPAHDRVTSAPNMYAASPQSRLDEARRAGIILELAPQAADLDYRSSGRRRVPRGLP